MQQHNEDNDSFLQMFSGYQRTWKKFNRFCARSISKPTFVKLSSFLLCKFVNMYIVYILLKKMMAEHLLKVAVVLKCNLNNFNVFSTITSA